MEILKQVYQEAVNQEIFFEPVSELLRNGQYTVYIGEVCVVQQCVVKCVYRWSVCCRAVCVKVQCVVRSAVCSAVCI